MTFLNKSKVEHHSLNLLVKGNVVNGVSFVSAPKDNQDKFSVELNNLGKSMLEKYNLDFLILWR